MAESRDAPLLGCVVVGGYNGTIGSDVVFTGHVIKVQIIMAQREAGDWTVMGKGH